ncbi:hypothetical protein IWX91DRAFT_341763, partial [Phyllosticta citricarpa]
FFFFFFFTSFKCRFALCTHPVVPLHMGRLLPRGRVHLEKLSLTTQQGAGDEARRCGCELAASTCISHGDVFVWQV